VGSGLGLIDWAKYAIMATEFLPLTERNFMVFNANLAMLPPPQLRLWQDLDATPKSFTLYGGTALALRLGHRVSIDFDFFSNQPFDPDDLAASIPYLI
jgi:hypothetical protein